MKDILRRLGSLLLSTAFANALALAAVVLLAKAMGPESFGIYNVALTVVNIVIAPLSIGLGTAAVRRIASGEDPPAVIGETLLFSTICFLLAILLLFAARGSLLHFDVVSKIDEHSIYIVSFSAAILCSSAADAYLRGLKQTRRLGLIRVLSAAVNLGVAFFYASSAVDVGPEAPFVGRLAELTIFTVVALAGMAGLRRMRVAGIKELLGYGVPAYISVLALALFLGADKFLIGELLDYRELGRYSFAFFLTFTVASRLVDIGMAVLFPEAVQHPDKSALATRLFRLTPVLLGLLTLGLFAFLWAVTLFVRGQYQYSLVEMVLFSLAGALFFVSHVHWWFVGSISHARMSQFAIASVACCAVAVALDFVWIPRYALHGALAALLVSCTILCGAGALAVRHVSKKSDD